MPGLACLATSRQRIGIAGEREVAVRPLPIPAASEKPERLLEFSGIQLFVDRARAADITFGLTPDNSRAVATLCHRLEGIPLAIELAAGWAALLTPQQMLEHLLQADHLTSRRKDAPARHRTLAASIEWSFRLLAPEMQRLFALLSVFRGGWSLEAAEAVALPPASPTHTGSQGRMAGSLVSLELLANLRDRSLIAAQELGGERRFRMLETLREFAGQQLTPGERDNVQQRHASYFLRFAETAAGLQRGDRAQTWLNQLEPERYNLLAALDWYLAQDFAPAGEPGTVGNGLEEGMRLVAALGPFWDARGELREARAYALAMLDKVGSVSPRIRTEVLLEAARMADSLSDLATSHRLLDEALVLTRQLGDRGLEADILNRLGVVFRDLNDYALALNMLQQSLVVRKEVKEPRGIAVTLADLGNVARDLSDTDRARAYYLESLDICRKFADKRGAAYALKALGVLAQEQGDLRSARQSFQESLTLYRELRNRWGIAYGLNSLGRLACEEGDPRAARKLLAEGLAIRRDLADRWSISQSLEAFAVLSIHLQEFRRAASLMGAAERLHEAIQSALPPNEHAELNCYTESTRAVLGDAAFTAAWDEGYALALEQAVSLALSE